MNTIGFLSFEPWSILEETPISADILYFDKLMFSSASIEIANFFCSKLPLRPIDKDLVKRKMNEIDMYMKYGLVCEYSADDFKKDYSIYHSIKEASDLGKYLIDNDFENPFLIKKNPKEEKFFTGAPNTRTAALPPGINQWTNPVLRVVLSFWLKRKIKERANL